MRIRQARAAIVAAVTALTLLTTTLAPAAASAGDAGGRGQGCHAGAPGVGDDYYPLYAATAATTSPTTC
jgi:hypothetical protein